MKTLTAAIILAAVLFFLIFSPWTKHLLPFWSTMSLSIATRTIFALIATRKTLRKTFCFRPLHIITGILSALLLYLIFYIGNSLSTALFDSAAPQIQNIYAVKSDTQTIVIAALLLLIIGPGEEIFWRAFIQQRLVNKYSALKGLALAAVIYAAVHVPSLNFMLITAAAICGLYWGALFLVCRSVWPVIISHALWDILIFLIIPIQ